MNRQLYWLKESQLQLFHFICLTHLWPVHISTLLAFRCCGVTRPIFAVFFYFLWEEEEANILHCSSTVASCYCHENVQLTTLIEPPHSSVGHSRMRLVRLDFNHAILALFTGVSDVIVPEFERKQKDNSLISSQRAPATAAIDIGNWKLEVKWKLTIKVVNHTKFHCLWYRPIYDGSRTTDTSNKFDHL